MGRAPCCSRNGDRTNGNVDGKRVGDEDTDEKVETEAVINGVGDLASVQTPCSESSLSKTHL